MSVGDDDTLKNLTDVKTEARTGSVVGFELTSSQKIAFDKIIAFLNSDIDRVFVLAGSAGTGKTTLTKIIVKYIGDMKSALPLKVCGIAPTHKAKRVLSNVLNSNKFLLIPTFTIASILGKIREHSHIGAKVFVGSDPEKLSNYQCAIIDEISMISNDDLNVVLAHSEKQGIKLILIGDNYQLPCPSQKLIRRTDKISGDAYLFRQESIAFSNCIAEVIELREIVRQVNNSPIIQLATYIRDHMNEPIDLKTIKIEGMQELEYISDPNLIYSKYIELYALNKNTRIIAYTNPKVQEHNTRIRHEFGYKSKLLKDELITGYANFGYPQPIIENGADYIVVNVTPVFKTIYAYQKLSGINVTLLRLDAQTQHHETVFIIDTTHSNNVAFMDELVLRAETVNAMGSTKKDFKLYHEFKNYTVFMEDIYKYGEYIYNESVFKQTHPLLFTRVSDIYDPVTKKILDPLSHVHTKFVEVYGEEFILNRIADTAKYTSDSETFADGYKVIEKDIDYGYAMTTHKSQGSTYHTVFVDDQDFRKLTNRWNPKYNLYENRIREQNQLKYVAYTRPSTRLLILTLFY